MSEPLVVEFAVEASPAHAFAVWTERCATWWPASHTVSGRPSAITFEAWAGGRIFERGPAGEEHDWGEVLEWEPAVRLRYRWHLFFAPAEATEVEVTFSPVGAGTAVRLEQRGWEALGEAGPGRRSRTRETWSALVAGFAAAAGREERRRGGAR